jgi:hypothetical protein
MSGSLYDLVLPIIVMPKNSLFQWLKNTTSSKKILLIRCFRNVCPDAISVESENFFPHNKYFGENHEAF